MGPLKEAYAHATFDTGYGRERREREGNSVAEFLSTDIYHNTKWRKKDCSNLLKRVEESLVSHLPTLKAAASERDYLERKEKVACFSLMGNSLYLHFALTNQVGLGANDISPER